MTNKIDELGIQRYHDYGAATGCVPCVDGDYLKASDIEALLSSGKLVVVKPIKDVDELVEEVLPDNIHDTHRFILDCREKLKSAIKQGKLVKPMSEDEIKIAMAKRNSTTNISEAVYKAQFERK